MDAYLDALPAWQRDICARVRDLVHSADPEVEETIKRSVQPYFVLDGNICALLAAKDHVNVFLYDGAIVPDPEGIITAGHDNKTASTVALPQRPADQRAGPADDVPTDHRQQSGRRLAASSRRTDRLRLGACRLSRPAARRGTTENPTRRARDPACRWCWMAGWGTHRPVGSRRSRSGGPEP